MQRFQYERLRYSGHDGDLLCPEEHDRTGLVYGVVDDGAAEAVACGDSGGDLEGGEAEAGDGEGADGDAGDVFEEGGAGVGRFGRGAEEGGEGEADVVEIGEGVVERARAASLGEKSGKG